MYVNNQLSIIQSKKGIFDTMNLLRSLSLLFLLVFYFSVGYAKIIIIGKPDTLLLVDTTITLDTASINAYTKSLITLDPNIKDSVVIVKTTKHRKTIAAILAFPLPFGVLGLHRLFLGTKPYIPFAYLGTLGGCFGILPLIDFINILLSDKDIYKNFENNPKVFMWVQ